MKKLFILLLVLSSLCSFSQSTTVVISQVYGGGGSASGTFNSDYVELHNVSNTDQDISGFKIFYGSATGNLASSATNAFQFPVSGVIIPAGGFLLVATTASVGISPLPVAPDYIFTLTLSGTNGKVAFGTADMLSNATLAAQPTGSVIDFVGYGTANESETTSSSALNATSALFRNGNGCTDTNNNSSDFTLSTPNPRYSGSPVAICGVTPLPPSITVTSTLTAFGNICIDNEAGPNTFAISGSNLDATDIVIGPLTGYSFSLLPAGPYTAILNLPQTGGAYASFVNVKFLPTAVQSYVGNIPVTGGGASPVIVAASGYGVDAAVVFTSNASGVTPTTATLPGTLFPGCDPVTAYGIEYSTTAAFTPGTGIQVPATNLSGSGFSVSLSSLAQSTTYYFVAYATTAAGTVYGTTIQTFTTGFESTGGSGVVISQIFGGGGGATSTYNADYVELHNNSLTDQNISGCKIMYGSSAGNLGSATGNIFTFPAGTIIPSGGYLLVATAAGVGLANLPLVPDQIFTLTLSATNGKVVFGSSSLLSNTALAAQPAGSVYDMVGYGTANEFETAAAPALSATTAAFRNNNGCDDTDDNSADITAATPSPRNSASPLVICSSLPVTLTRFDARKSGEKVEVSWTTSSETALREFAVERSRNGQQWEVISTVAPIGTGVTTANYFVTDSRPFSGVNMYRLQTLNMNGSKEYSTVKSVVFTKGTQVLVYPNPTVDQINVYLDKLNGSASAQLINAGGKLISQTTITGNQMRLSTAHLPRGVYMLKVNNGQQVIISKIILN